MAKYYHKPYSRRRGKNKKGKKIIVVLILLIAAGIYMLNRSDDDNEEGYDYKPDMDDIIAINGDDAGSDQSPVESDDAGLGDQGDVVVLQEEPVKEEVPVEKPAPKVVEVEDTGVTSEDAKALLAEGQEHISRGEVIAARVKLNESLNLKLSGLDREKVKAMLTELSKDWLFSKKAYDEDILVTTYPVQRGDNLGAIGSKFKVPHQILVKINGLSSDRALQAGSTIKVVKGPFHAIVDCSSFTMDLYLQNTYVKTYRVGLGKEDTPTPLGRWKVKAGQKMIKPPWLDEAAGKVYYPDDPEYPLGARWIEIEGLDEGNKNRTGIALHGTKEPESIGTLCSNGCVRLIDEEVIEVYGMLYEAHSLVQIVD